MCEGVFGGEATASVLFQRLTRHSQEARGSHGPHRKTNAPHPFFPSLRSDVINYHQNARDSERECESARQCVCVCACDRERERTSEAVVKKGTIVCAEIKKSPLNHCERVRLENAPKCRVW